MVISVEDYDQLLRWILQALRLFSVSNPDVLSTFAISVLRQSEGSDSEQLRSTCLEELQTFLKEETIEFVDMLVSTLEGMHTPLHLQ
jgi:hypothetical protein